MRGTGGSAETLGVDSKSLSNLGNDMLSAADDIPPPPAPFTVSGTDPISTKIMGMQSDLETPIQTGLPEAKTGAKKTANSIVAAATKYETTDEQLATQIEQHTFDKAGSPSVGGGLGGAQGVVGFKSAPVESTGFSTPNHVGGKVGGDAPVSAPRATTNVPSASSPGGGPPSAETPASGAPGSGASGAGTSSGAAPAAGTPAAATPTSAAGTSAASGAGAMGQMGQMISMPMQMAGQAVGMAAAVPQTIMQGVESAVQQVSQLTGGLGQDGDSSASDAQLTADHKGDESSTRPAESPKTDQAHDGAAPGQPHGERAPDGQPHAAEQAPVAPPADQKPPAQTRPAEVAQETNL
ncbi:MAG: hypothetical protein QOE30_4004 [Mycobacterium sp.]|jgi:hypothetical protein|uniref:hypothetical protein n=1 Tax=Mycobacterium sp. TaxID=1785 RepID=UPI0028B73B36|nr:hypothetical protein [Mycobacterium sp.]MDT5118265.1 hypothetical protein [Mycobacterium sp.]